MPAPNCHRLFFAVRPPRHVVSEIAYWRDKSGLVGDPVIDAHLHVTLFLLGAFHSFPEDIVARAQAAVSAVDLPAFRVGFDLRVGGAKTGLLSASERSPGAQMFFQRLKSVLARARIRKAPGWQFQPHVTLRHGAQAPGVQVPGVQAPGVQAIDMISWENDQLLLIDSLHGLGQHCLCQAWPLTRRKVANPMGGGITASVPLQSAKPSFIASPELSWA